jgi:hypothetical protein
LDTRGDFALNPDEKNHDHQRETRHNHDSQQNRDELRQSGAKTAVNHTASKVVDAAYIHENLSEDIGLLVISY